MKNNKTASSISDFSAVVEDISRSGGPSTSATEENIKTYDQMELE